MTPTTPIHPPQPPPRRTCANCVRNVEGVCTYVNRGNAPDPPDCRGRKITWPMTEKCGQHRLPVEPWMSKKTETW